MNDITEAQREALLASAAKHEEAAGKALEIAETLTRAGYLIHAKKLRACVEGMVRFVDHARDRAQTAALSPANATSEAGGANEDSEAAERRTEVAAWRLRIGARVRHTGRASGYGEGKITATIGTNEWAVAFDDGKQRELYDWALEVIE